MVTDSGAVDGDAETSDRRLKERDLDGLRAILNEWDPIGVMNPQAGGLVDEYDCLRGPLVSHLERGASRGEIAAFLVRDLHEHFGFHATVTDEAVDRILAWWQVGRRSLRAAGVRA